MSFPLKNIAALIFVAFIFVSLASTAAAQTSLTPTPAPRPTTSYELFWPIVAGKIPGDTLYPLKALKEKFQLLTTFSTSKKANLYLTLSKKRLIESEKLFLETKNYDLAVSTLKLSADHLKQSITVAKTLPSGQISSEIKARIIRESENETFFLKLLIEKLPSEQKSSTQSVSSQMEQIITSLKSS